MLPEAATWGSGRFVTAAPGNQDCLKKNPYPRICVFIDVRERKRETSTHPSGASPEMNPKPRCVSPLSWNPKPFGVQEGAPTNEPPGQAEPGL